MTANEDDFYDLRKRHHAPEPKPEYTTASPVWFRAGPILDELAARTPPGGTFGLVARRDLSRLYEIYADELIHLDLDLTAAVAVLPLVAQGDALHTLRNLTMSPTKAAHAVATLPPGAYHAVIDACERAQLLTAAGASSAEAVRQVGLVR